MAVLTWDDTGTREFETGVSQGVLYVKGSSGYETGVAWNGLISVTESPSGAEANDLYADDIKYAVIRSAEDFGFTIEAYTYPDEFEQCDGAVSLMTGLTIAQQERKPFGFVYKSKIGDDEHPGIDKAYKLHIIYNATANPSDRQYQTINDSPDAITMSWECTTVPVPLEGYKPTAHVIVDTRYFDEDALETLEETLFGTVSSDPTLPELEDLLTLLIPSS